MEHAWSGEWVGYYEDPTVPRTDGRLVFGIEATFVHWEGRIEGTMLDLQPEYDVPARMLAASPAAGLWEPWDHRRFEQFLSVHPDAVYRTILPSHSTLFGRVSRDRIELEKQYQGNVTTAWADGDHLFGPRDTPGHRVRYRGQLSEEGREIAGTWTIPAPGLRGILGGHRGEGAFRLVRKTADVVK